MPFALALERADNPQSIGLWLLSTTRIKMCSAFAQERHLVQSFWWRLCSDSKGSSSERFSCVNLKTNDELPEAALQTSVDCRPRKGDRLSPVQKQESTVGILGALQRQVDLQGVFVKIGDFIKFKGSLVEFLENRRS